MALVTAVRKAVGALETAPVDQGAAQLAITYARAIDAGGDLDKLGPQLLAVLEALGMTPRARAAVAKGGPSGNASANPLDELRKRRAARQRAAEAGDPAAS